MLPNLSTLHLKPLICLAVNTPFPSSAKAAIEDEECAICNTKFRDDSVYGAWGGAGASWIVQCVNNHIIHKLCLKEQLDKATEFVCSECREPISDTIVNHVNPQINRRIRPRAEEREDNSGFYRLIREVMQQEDGGVLQQPISLEEVEARRREEELAQLEVVVDTISEEVAALRRLGAAAAAEAEAEARSSPED